VLGNSLQAVCSFTGGTTDCDDVGTDLFEYGNVCLGDSTGQSQQKATSAALITNLLQPFRGQPVQQTRLVFDERIDQNGIRAAGGRSGKDLLYGWSIGAVSVSISHGHPGLMRPVLHREAEPMLIPMQYCVCSRRVRI
jgi:hypothetical protein